MKKQFIIRKFHDVVPKDDRTYVLYGRAPDRATALHVKAACEDEGAHTYVTRGIKHYYIWVELAWMQIDPARADFIFDPGICGKSDLVYTTT